jgi:hypothetical protein
VAKRNYKNGVYMNIGEAQSGKIQRRKKVQKSLSSKAPFAFNRKEHIRKGESVKHRLCITSKQRYSQVRSSSNWKTSMRNSMTNLLKKKKYIV